MRIINTVLGDATGGRWSVVETYARVLASAGHQVTLLCNQRHPPARWPADLAGVRQRMLRVAGHYDPVASLAAWRLLRSTRAELVIAHCSRSVALFGRVSGAVPVVAVTHSNKVRRALAADAFINISRHIGRLVEAGGAGDRPSFHIPNAVPAPAAMPARPPWRTPVRVGAFGRFDPVKGLDLFVRALGRLRQRGVRFQARLGGAGEQAAVLEGLVRELGLEDCVERCGWVDDRQAFFDAIDILCVPARSDAFGLTPLEAAAAGVPLVLSDAEGHRDMFEDGVHAAFFPRDDAGALADRLAQAIGRPDEARILAASAFRRVAEEFNPRRFARRLEDAVASLAGASAGRG